MGFGQDIVQSDEGAATNEKDVSGVDMPVVPETYRRSLHDLEQGVLDAFSRGRVGLPGSGFQLVYFIDENDAMLSAGDVTIGFLDQAIQDGLDFVANKLCLGERCGISSDKRQIENAGQRFAKQGFSGAGRPDEQDVAFAEFHALDRRIAHHAAKMCVNGDRQRAFRSVLTNDVFGKQGNDFTGLQQGWHRDIRGF